MASPKINPEQIARTFSLYVKAGVRILAWTVIAVASAATTYVVVRALWIAVQMTLKALGI